MGGGHKQVDADSVCWETLASAWLGRGGSQASCSPQADNMNLAGFYTHMLAPGNLVLSCCGRLGIRKGRMRKPSLTPGSSFLMCECNSKCALPQLKPFMAPTDSE